MDDEVLLNELKNTKMPMHEKVNAIFAGTQSLFAAATPILNVVRASQNKSEFEQAVAGTYYRMHLLAESLTRLNNKRDFQVALQITRTMYELYIDLIELTSDPLKVQQFFAFGFVAKFGAAKKLVDELTKQGIVDPSVAKHERAFVNDPQRQAKYDAELLKYWPNSNGRPKAPLSWSGKYLPDRAEAIGKSEIIRYRTIYALLCWFSHAGLVGLVNMSEEGIESSMGYAHAHTQDIFFDATNVIAGVFKIYEANSKLKEPVDAYKLATAKILANFAMRSLEAKRIDGETQE